MKDLKQSYDKLLVAVSGLAALGIAAYVVMGATDLSTSLEGPPVVDKGEAFAPSTELTRLKADVVAMSQPAAWNDGKGSLFASRIYLLREGRLVDILESDNRLFPGIPNSWILEHNLDYTDAQLPERDPDKDNFSNLEEYTGKTNPGDASSTPPVPNKLRMTASKIEQLPFLFNEPRLQVLSLPCTTKKGNKLVTISKDATASLSDTDQLVLEGADLLGVKVVCSKPGIIPDDVTIEAIAANKKEITLSKPASLDGAKVPLELQLEGAVIRCPSGASEFFAIGSQIFTNETEKGRTKRKREATPFKLVRIDKAQKVNPKTGTIAEVYSAVVQSSLDKREVILEQRTSTASPYSIATLVDTRPGGQTWEGRAGNTFSLGQAGEFMLLEVTASKAIIQKLDSEEKFEVPFQAVTLSPEQPTEQVAQ